MWLHEALEYWARQAPDANFAVHGDRTMTYGEADERIDRIAGALAESCAVGDRIAVLSRNSLDMVLLYFAASKAGVVPVPLNYRLAPSEMSFILEDSEAKQLFVQAEYWDDIAGIRGDLHHLRDVIALDPVEASGPTLRDFEGPRLSAEAAYERRHDEAMQIYTSGTTGHPKGAVLTQASLFSIIHQWRMMLPMSRGDRLLLVAPLYHIGGTLYAFHCAEHGASIYLQTDFDPVEVVRALDEERIRIAFLVPAMIQACLDVPDVAARPYESFELLAYGAAPISEPTLRRAMEVWGCEFNQSFGMTECPCITYLTPEDHLAALRGADHLLESTGRVGPGSGLKIVGENGEELPPGSIGEILGRGPQLMQGYWQREDATAEALVGGWMHTGDMGLVDEDGYLFVKDRKKDMIVSGAENVYPREVEIALHAHPDVADVAVIGVPDERWGETVHAVVVLREGAAAVTSDELIRHCRERLARYKCPRSIAFIHELPRNPSGKVLKRVLREPFWQDRTRQIS